MKRGARSQDTIVAVATPAGRGGIGVIRISGVKAREIAEQVLGHLPSPRYATLSDFRDSDGTTIDSGIALFFPSPQSFSGEDVLELQGHGGAVVMDMLLDRCVGLGARIALPGEFSERAFLNDKLDLAQAEAIADLIDSVSRQAARSAVRSLAGEFSRRVQDLAGKLVNLRMFVEAAIDFPEEEVDFLSEQTLVNSLVEIETVLFATINTATSGALLREGFSMVIIGRPNAGKSSLMNRLTGTDTAIVTGVPGTTRDLLAEMIHLDGIPVRLVDTAGIRVTEDEVEIEGVRRAVRAAAGADIVLVVIDAEQHAADWQVMLQTLLAEVGDVAGGALVVLNKVDLLADPAAIFTEGESAPVLVSARTGQGLEILVQRIKALLGYNPGAEDLFIARRRHLDALHRCRAHLAEGHNQLRTTGAGELLAEELRLGHEALCEITGEFTSDDLLGAIFSSFCIGK